MSPYGVTRPRIDNNIMQNWDNSLELTNENYGMWYLLEDLFRESISQVT